MLEPRGSRTSEPVAARVLPRDDKIRILQSECQRDLEAALGELQRFRDLWFVADPPRRGEARETLTALLQEISRIRNAALELSRQIEP
ncbi:MAG: hypothetical protein WBG19_07395 [Thermoplasmata archaeon]